MSPAVKYVAGKVGVNSERCVQTGREETARPVRSKQGNSTQGLSTGSARKTDTEQ